MLRPPQLRAGQRRAEVRERRQQRPGRLDLRAGLVDAVVQAERRRAERHRARLARRAELVGVGVAVGDAQAAHHRDQRDVDDVVVRPPAVRIAGEVLRRRAEQAAEQAEAVLLRFRRRPAIAVLRRSISDATPVDGDAPKRLRLVHARDAGQERRDQVGAREVGRRDVRRRRARSRAARAASGSSRRSANWPSSFGFDALNCPCRAGR